MQGFPKTTTEDFTRENPPPEVDLTKGAEEMYEKHREMMCRTCPMAEHTKSYKIGSPILAAISNFSLAKKLHKENLEHEPLPDTIAHKMYRKLQMQRNGIDPGLAIDAENQVTGIGWKEHGAYGPTRCTKMRVFRPKTCIHNKIINEHENRPSSVSSFDRKWRFIRQSKVSPIDLAICWDLSPENPDDEPVRPKHIDGSNGSEAPAVFTLVHTPKENDLGVIKEPKCDGIHGCGPLFEHRNECDDIKNNFFERPKTSSEKSSKSSSASSKKRAKSATNLIDEEIASESSQKSFHKSVPDLKAIKDIQAECKDCSKPVKKKKNKYCQACQKKPVPWKENKPKNEFKMAFKAGLAHKVSNRPIVKILRVPLQKDPCRLKAYKIDSLAAPFSLQNRKRVDYPDHWRLASVYQQSYKPIELRKRPLLATVYN